MTKKQKIVLMNLMADHRNAEDVADYEASPTMQAVLKYVNGLLTQQKRKTVSAVSRTVQTFTGDRYRKIAANIEG